MNMEAKMNRIDMELSEGDFSSFDTLTETQKRDIAENWNKDMRMKYLNRHSSMTEEEFFSELDKIANVTLTGSESHSEEFSYLDNLDEDRKIEIMKGWDKATWIRYRMQNTVSEQEVFDPIMKLIEEDDD